MQGALVGRLERQLPLSPPPLPLLLFWVIDDITGLAKNYSDGGLSWLTLQSVDMSVTQLHLNRINPSCKSFEEIHS